MLQSSSFTVTSNGGLLRVLQTACKVAEAFDPSQPPPHPALHDFVAIWDTGATNSCITERVVNTCALKATGMTQVHGVGGVQLSEAYLVNLWLPNNLGVQQVRVTKGSVATADVLIGMDVITLGDFAVTNQGGRTVFTFCMPSHRHLDFVIEHNKAQQALVPQKGFRGYNPQSPKPRHHK